MSSGQLDGDDVLFNTEVDPEVELQEMQRQVSDLQEDLRLKALQETAAQDEGQRKNTGVMGSKNTSVFVGGMDTRTTESDLRVFFSACGTIKRLTMLRDKFTGQQKGTAYVEFESVEEATAAIVKNGQSLHGRPLTVAMKRDNIPAFQRGRGGFPRGGYRGGGPGAMQQQMAMAATMMATMMGGHGGMNFSPYRGGVRGRGRGRGRGGPY